MSPSKLDEIKAISVGSFNEFLKLADSNEDKAALTGRMCCLSHVSAQLVEMSLESVTCDDKSVNPKQHFSQLFAAIQKSGLDLTCGEWKDIAACEAKIKEPLDQMRMSILNTKETTIGDQSIISPLKKIAEKVAN